MDMQPAGAATAVARHNTRRTFQMRMAYSMAASAARMATSAACMALAVSFVAPSRADDTGGLYVAPGPSTLFSSDAIKRYQEQPGVATRKLGDIIGSSLRSPNNQATELVVTTQCGHYRSATITYADGSAKTLNLGNAPATKTDIPILRIVDIAGCD
jgi:hypothetical protein